MRTLNKTFSYLLLIILIVLFSVSVSAATTFDKNINFSYDDFEGADGDPWNSNKWTQQGTGGTADINSNQGDQVPSAQIFMVTDQNVWEFTNLDDINFSFTFSEYSQTSGFAIAQAGILIGNGSALTNNCETSENLICVRATDKASNFGVFVDGNLITRTSPPQDSNIIFNLQKVQDQNNFVIQVYIDGNREANLTVTTTTFDLNLYFGCIGVDTPVNALCKYDTFDINGQDFTDLNFIKSIFTVTPDPVGLDPENAITNVRADFNSITQLIGITDVNYSWTVDGEVVSTDQNTVHDFNVIGDFNVSLLAVGQDGVNTFTSQSDQNIAVSNVAQNIDINFVFTPTASSSDINFIATPAGEAAYVWGFPNDQNQTGQNILKSFTTGQNVEVCVIVTTTGDVNKLKCKTFYNTHVIAKVPINLSTLLAVTNPFDMSMNTKPGQAFSQVSVDQNFWVFYGGSPDRNSFNLITDANVSFLVTTNIVKINAFDLNQTIQPYVVLSTVGIQVIFTALDSLTNDVVPGVILAFSRIAAGLGTIQTSSGVTDDLGRISLPFIPNLDHDFNLEFPQGTILKTGIYNPQSTDATNGVNIVIPSISGIGDTNAIGEVDINFLQDRVTRPPSGLVDLNQIISSSRAISGIGITIDHNGVNLFSDTNNTAIATGGIFGQNIDINGLSNIFPLIVTVDLNFADGGTFQVTKAVTITGLDFGLESSLRGIPDDLGGLGGTMVIIAFVLALVLGIFHWTFPQVDNSHSYLIAATLLLFLSFVNLIDGVSWILAAIAGGAAYFSRRLDR